MLWSLMVSLALGAPPENLDQLVALTLERDPEAAIIELEASAARIRAENARRQMDPQLMIGVDALGAMPDDPDPTMFMVGATQMLRGWGEGRALRDRYEVDVRRAALDRERVAADLRLRLAQVLTRIAAWREEEALLEQHLEAARALQALALARYGAGASAAASMSAMEPGMDETSGGMPSLPPTVERRSAGGTGAMPGMSGGGMPGMSGGMPPVAPGTMSPGGMAGAPGMSGGQVAMAGGQMGTVGLAALLRLESELARLDAQLQGLRARLAGEQAVLSAYAGEEAAAVVFAQPERFLGEQEPVSEPPERGLARLEAEAAAADLELSRLARRPDLMVSAAERFMPDGMPAGTDLGLGIEVPLWGSRGAAIDAARAELAAAEGRTALVERELAVAAASARAARDAALARLQALETVSLPRARAAFEATTALVASGRASVDEAVQMWEAWLDVRRQVVDAREETRLRAAELARLEGR